MLLRPAPLHAAALSALAMLAACGSKPAPENDLDRLDRELAQANSPSPANDPALRSALRDEIMVDPALTRQANTDVIRPPAQPASGGTAPPLSAEGGKAAQREALRSAPPAGACPQCAAAREALTLGALARAQGGKTGACAPRVTYSAEWSNRLPRSMPLYPDARVSEAAGADGAGCALRIVSFSSAAPVQRLLDWYYTRTSGAGFSAQHGRDGAAHVLAGTKPGAAFLVIVKARSDGGSDTDVMIDGD